MRGARAARPPEGLRGAAATTVMALPRLECWQTFAPRAASIFASARIRSRLLSSRQALRLPPPSPPSPPCGDKVAVRAQTAALHASVVGCLRACGLDRGLWPDSRSDAASGCPCRTGLAACEPACLAEPRGGWHVVRAGQSTPWRHRLGAGAPRREAVPSRVGADARLETSRATPVDARHAAVAALRGPSPSATRAPGAARLAQSSAGAEKLVAGGSCSPCAGRVGASALQRRRTQHCERSVQRQHSLLPTRECRCPYRCPGCPPVPSGPAAPGAAVRPPGEP